MGKTPFDPDAGRLRGAPTHCWREDSAYKVSVELCLPEPLSGEFIVYGGDGWAADPREATRRAAEDAEGCAYADGAGPRGRWRCRLRNRDLAIPLPPKEEIGG